MKKIVVLGTEENESRHFGESLRFFPAEVTYVDPDEPEAIVDHYQPDLVVVSREWTPSFRLAIAAAKRADVPVVYIMDGVVEWSYIWNNLSFVQPEGSVLQPLMASDLVAIGRHPARILASLGLSSRIHVVGLPRLDSLVRAPAASVPERTKVLIASAKTAAHNPAQQVSVRSALADLKLWFDSNSSIQPIWRISDDLAFDLGITPDDSGSIEVAIIQARATVALTSTVLLESMALGVPTACLEYRAVPLLVQTAWEIRSQEHIASVIPQMCFPSPELLSYQNFLIEDELEPAGSGERLAKVFETAIERRWNFPAQPVDGIGALDFQQVHSQLSMFSIGSGPQLQHELDSAYKMLEQMRTRAKLAESRVGIYEDGWVKESLAGSDQEQQMALRVENLEFRRLAKHYEQAHRDSERWLGMTLLGRLRQLTRKIK